MPHSALFFFDVPLSEKVPGFPHDIAPSLFPFWGSYTFFDFALANTYHLLEKSSPKLFTMRDHYKQISSYLEKWKGIDIGFNDISVDAATFLQLLKALKEDYVLLYKTSSLFFASKAKLTEKREVFRHNISKLSMENIPVDFYFCNRKHLLQTIHDYLPSLPAKGLFCEHLFTHILHAAFDAIIDIPGQVLFQNNLMQLYRSNLSLVQNNILERKQENFSNMPVTSLKDSIISGTGCVKNSYFAAGTKIDGYVENSVIFEGVHIREQSRVINSVIMNNNQIGRDSFIINTLLFPAFHENIGNLTIGEKTKIGSKNSQASNRDFPKQINSGLTVIGCNAGIPDNIIVEPASFVASNVSSAVIKRAKVVRKSTSLYSSNNR